MYEIRHHIYWDIWEIVYYTSNGILMSVKKFDTENDARKFIESKKRV